MPERYLIALGSNVRHHRYGSPRGVLRAAFAVLAEHGIAVERCSRMIDTLPHGPSLRRYANAAAVAATSLAPDAFLAELKTIERAFGRKRGRRWGARVLDLDIILWEQGAWDGPGPIIPHLAFRERAFVLIPAVEVAAAWRDPVTGLTVRQLARRRYTF